MDKISNIVDQRLLPGIHGLRGLAAACVMLYHIVRLANINPPEFFGFIKRDFGYSVHLFFILSAYSLMHSTLHKISDNNWLNDYFIKRFFRIAPLFYVMILVMFLTQKVEINKLLLNLTFMFGMSPRTGIVWGGWSVGVEMLFYVLFPVLLLLVNSTKKALMLCLLSIVSGCLIRADLHLIYSNFSSDYDWSKYSFGPNSYFFCYGIFAFYFVREYNRRIKNFNAIVAIFALAILGMCLLTDIDSYLKNMYRTDMIVWGMGLTALAIWQANKSSFVFNNKVMFYLGERSYSIYLIHPVVIFYLKENIGADFANLQNCFGEYAFFICSLKVFVLVLLIAELTYRFIEIPGINLGKRIINRKNTV